MPLCGEDLCHQLAHKELIHQSPFHLVNEGKEEGENDCSCVPWDCH